MKHPLIQHYDDERSLGNGIIVTLKPGIFFYDDCGVQSFDSPQAVAKEIARIAQRGADNADHKFEMGAYGVCKRCGYERHTTRE